MAIEDVELAALVPQTLDSETDRGSVEKLRGMLTAQQIEKYRQIEMARKGGNGVGPVARPTTKAAEGA